MVSVAARDEYLTPEQYLDSELKSSTRHEYVQGRIYAIVVVSDSHSLIAGNLFAHLWNHLQHGECRVYMSDMKVQVIEANAFYYPDILVTCDERDRESEYSKQHPCVIVEVHSRVRIPRDLLPGGRVPRKGQVRSDGTDRR